MTFVVPYDAHSGVAYCYVQMPNTSYYTSYSIGTELTEEGTYSFYCTDRCGNKSDYYTVTLDKSAQADESADGLRVYRYTKNGEYYEMIVNESSSPLTYSNPRGLVYALDYLDGVCRTVASDVPLKRGESVVLRNTQDGLTCVDGMCDAHSQERFDVCTRELFGEDFSAYKSGIGVDFDVNARDELPDFAGWIKYSFEADMSQYDGLKVEYSGDGCEVLIGEQSFVGVGKTLVCLCEDKGVCKIDIVLRTSLAYKFRDGFSTYSYVEPCMLHKVTYLKKK